jgi:hypothetical protein
MIRFLSYLGSHSFGLMYLPFHFLIPFNNGFENCTRLRVRLIVSVFNSGLLSW